MDASSFKRFRVWWDDEFKDCKTDEEREDLAWAVPPEHGIFNPDMIIECTDVDEAARKYADFFYNERDGHENTWPLTFVVHDGRTYFRIEVELDFEPTFSSSDPEEFTP